MARKHFRTGTDSFDDLSQFRPYPTGVAGAGAGKSGGKSGGSLPNPAKRARAELEFDEPAILGALFGQYDANLVLLENRLGVYISARGNRIVIEGNQDQVARAREVLQGMHRRLLSGQDVDVGAVESLIAMSVEPTLEGIISGDATHAPIMIRTRGKTIVPRSPTQIDYMRALAKNDVIFALGPAGTGKTYIAEIGRAHV